MLAQIDEQSRCAKKKSDLPKAMCSQCGATIFSKKDILIIEGNKVNIKIEPGIKATSETFYTRFVKIMVLLSVDFML